MSTDWANWPDGVTRRILEQVDSTNAQASRIAPTLAGPEWILGLRQSVGRGRRGRRWVDTDGNFAATYVMQPTGATAQVALRSFVASLALFDALVAATGRAEIFTLKWPNDVLLNGGKLAGILLESIGSGGRASHLAIGIGVNLMNAPDIHSVKGSTVRPVCLADETGVQLTPQELLALLAPAYAHWEEQFSTYGFAPVRTAWLARAGRIGQQITARIGSTETTGIFETVDEAGMLVLSTAKGRQVIPAADVFF